MRYVAILFPALLYAQEFRGTILGRVTDLSGAVVANAAIRVTNTETGVGIDTKTNPEGNCQAPTFGVITTLKTDGDARRVEGSLRISL